MPFFPLFVLAGATAAALLLAWLNSPPDLAEIFDSVWAHPRISDVIAGEGKQPS